MGEQTPANADTEEGAISNRMRTVKWGGRVSLLAVMLGLLATVGWFDSGVARACDPPAEEIELEAGVPLFIDETDGVYTFLTATVDCDVWMQRVDYTSGKSIDTLLTNHGEATRPTQPVPGNASTNYVPDPTLPTVMYYNDGSIVSIDANSQVHHPDPTRGQIGFVGAKVNNRNMFFPTTGVVGGIFE